MRAAILLSQRGHQLGSVFLRPQHHGFDDRLARWFRHAGEMPAHGIGGVSERIAAAWAGDEFPGQSKETMPMHWQMASAV